jgi:hypothetical protein
MEYVIHIVGSTEVKNHLDRYYSMDYSAVNSTTISLQDIDAEVSAK